MKIRLIPGHALLLALLGLFAACTSSEAPTQETESAAPADYHSRRSLWEVEDLNNKLDQNVAIIEVSKPEEYQKGHIPGARNLWRPDYEDHETYTYGGMRAPRKQMEQLLSQLGIEPGQTLVLYDERGNSDAARVFWILRRYGHPNLVILNGGKPAWEQAGFALEQENPAFSPTSYAFPTPEDWLQQSIDKEQVQASLGAEEVVLLDTRSPVEYEGKEQKKGAAKAGRIPGAVNLDWAYAINYGGDFRFKPAEELRRLYEEKGVLPDHKVIAYCHSGVRSAHTTFVLTELLGYPDVANYDGSWTEWSHFENLPFEVDSTTVESL